MNEHHHHHQQQQPTFNLQAFLRQGAGIRQSTTFEIVHDPCRTPSNELRLQTRRAEASPEALLLDRQSPQRWKAASSKTKTTVPRRPLRGLQPVASGDKPPVLRQRELSR
mmetsp:Transcript_22105/g.47871  ORF Transcript_22105/g.47871 Transcript_22105/m.47871 type:complete len:110 (+) Transcript_22105:249-578(+)